VKQNCYDPESKIYQLNSSLILRSNQRKKIIYLIKYEIFLENETKTRAIILEIIIGRWIGSAIIKENSFPISHFSKNYFEF